MRQSLLAASLLLLLAAGAAQKQPEGRGPAAGAAVPGGAAAATAASELPLPASLPASAEHAAPCQRLPFTDEFLHPLEQQKRLAARLTAVQAHNEMQRWLQAFFQNPASQLTSTRLADAHRATEAAATAAVEAAAKAAEAAAAAAGLNGTAVPAAVHAATAGDATSEALAGQKAQRGNPAAAAAEVEAPLQQRDGFADVPPPGPGCGNSSACVRAAAASLLARHERPGSPLRLRWPHFVEDARRWAAGPGPNGTCLPRQAGEAVRREYLLVVPVGNDISPVLE